MVTVLESANGKPYAIVIDSDVQATVTVGADGSAVTIVLRKPDEMPCSVIIPGHVAIGAFGPDFVAALAAAVRGDAGHGESHMSTESAEDGDE